MYNFTFSRTRETYVAREPSETSRECTSAQVGGNWRSPNRSSGDEHGISPGAGDSTDALLD